MVDKSSLFSIGKISSELYSLSQYTFYKRNTYLRDAIRKFDYDVIGIKNDEGVVQKYCDKDNNIHDITINDVCSIDMGIEKALNKLLNKSFAFIMTENGIEYILTRADLDKPEFHIYLFMLYTIYENILTEKIVENLKSDTNNEKIKKIMDNAKEKAENRKKDNSNLHFAYYLLLTEKIKIYTSLDLKSKLLIEEKYRKSFIDIRNNLAHGNSIFVNTDILKISHVENYLKKVTRINA